MKAGVTDASTPRRNRMMKVSVQNCFSCIDFILELLNYLFILFNRSILEQDLSGLPSKQSSSASASTAAVRSSIIASLVPYLELKEKTKTSALVAAVESSSVQIRTAFDKMMQQRLASEDLDFHLRREECEEL